MEEAQIITLLTLALSAVGFTQLSKKAVAKMSGVSVPPWAKQAVTVVAGLVLAAANGQEIIEVLPG